MNVTISRRNSKLGHVVNVSLPPIKACIPGVPCARECYACKAYRLYPNSRWAWDKNLLLAQNYRGAYFGDIREFLASEFESVNLFRWHTAGDIIDQDYLDNMVKIVLEFPTMRFLAFTKNHGLDYSNLPANISVVFSMWVGWGDTEMSMPRAWYQDGNKSRVPTDAMECFGKCDECGLCWYLKDLGRDVVFHKH